MEILRELVTVFDKVHNCLAGSPVLVLLGNVVGTINHHHGFGARILRGCRIPFQAIGKIGQVPVVIDSLREYGIGEWEDMLFEQLVENHDFVSRATRDPDFAPPGGESLDSVAERIVAALEEIHSRHDADGKVLIVGHGAALAVALGALLHSSPGRWVDYHFANCSLTELVLSPSPYVNFFNSTQHL